MEYVDETGNPIDGAPVTISLGKIEDHISLFGTDKNYEFKSARVDGADIVFIGSTKIIFITAQTESMQTGWKIDRSL